MAFIKRGFFQSGAVLVAAAVLLVWSSSLGAQDTAAERNDAEVQSGSGAGTGLVVDEEILARVVERSVAMRVRPLARELKEFKEEVRFHDVLGGIGYIVGLAGLAFYFLGVRRRDRNKMRSSDPERR